MAKFIKLTNDNGLPLLVNVEHIVSVDSESTGGCTVETEDCEHTVDESVEYIEKMLDVIN